MNPMRWTVVAIVALALFIVGVGLLVDSRLGDDDGNGTAAVNGELDNFARQQAFRDPTITLVQADPALTEWGWLYHPDRRTCVGSQVIARETTSTPIRVSGGELVIGSSGLAGLVVPTGAQVFSSLAVKLGPAGPAQTAFTIPYVPARERAGRATASFRGGIYTPVPAGGIPAMQSAEATLEIANVTAHDCYGVIRADWEEQVAVAISAATGSIAHVTPHPPTPMPTPTPIPVDEPLVFRPELLDSDTSGNLLRPVVNRNARNGYVVAEMYQDIRLGDYDSLGVLRPDAWTYTAASRSCELSLLVAWQEGYDERVRQTPSPTQTPLPTWTPWPTPTPIIIADVLPAQFKQDNGSQLVGDRVFIATPTPQPVPATPTPGPQQAFGTPTNIQNIGIRYQLEALPLLASSNSTIQLKATTVFTGATSQFHGDGPYKWTVDIVDTPPAGFTAAAKGPCSEGNDYQVTGTYPMELQTDAMTRTATTQTKEADAGITICPYARVGRVITFQASIAYSASADKKRAEARAYVMVVAPDGPEQPAQPTQPPQPPDPTPPYAQSVKWAGWENRSLSIDVDGVASLGGVPDTANAYAWAEVQLGTNAASATPFARFPVYWEGGLLHLWAGSGRMVIPPHQFSIDAAHRELWLHARVAPMPSCDGLGLQWQRQAAAVVSALGTSNPFLEWVPPTPTPTATPVGTPTPAPVQPVRPPHAYYAMMIEEGAITGSSSITDEAAKEFIGAAVLGPRCNQVPELWCSHSDNANSVTVTGGVTKKFWLVFVAPFAAVGSIQQANNPIELRPAFHDPIRLDGTIDHHYLPSAQLWDTSVISAASGTWKISAN